MPSEHAIEDHLIMMNYVKIMLCVGIIHGDLSEFNVLVDEYGPVIIDLPQAVDASANNNAKSMLLRDVDNMTVYFSQFAPKLMKTRYGKEIWDLYQQGELTVHTELSGNFKEDDTAADVDTVLEEIKAAFAEQEARQERILAAQEQV